MSFYVGDRLVCRYGWNSISSIHTCIPDGYLHRMTYIRCRIDTIDSPDDEHNVVRNMWNIEINIYGKNCASSWLFTRINSLNFDQIFVTNQKFVLTIIGSEINISSNKEWVLNESKHN